MIFLKSCIRLKNAGTSSDSSAYYAYTINQIDFHFSARVASASASPKLLVFLPGASNRGKIGPVFQRQTWAEEFPDCDVIAFADPTLQLDPDISIGWFQYREGNYGIRALASLLKRLIASSNYHDVTFFGSSAGGFVALKLSELFPNSLIVSINPQLFIQRYSAQHFNKMLEVAYPGLDSLKAVKKFASRFQVELPDSREKARRCIVQNTSDPHYKLQVEPFAAMLRTRRPAAYSNPLESGVHIGLYEDSTAGHSPPGRLETKELLTYLWGGAGEGFSEALIWETFSNGH